MEQIKEKSVWEPTIVLPWEAYFPESNPAQPDSPICLDLAHKSDHGCP
jgi:hypothetical protein